VFEDAEALVVRSVRGAFRVPPTHADAMGSILARLDGSNDYEALLGDQPTEIAFYALRMLDSFAQVGLLADGPISANAAGPEEVVATCPRLDGVSVLALDSGVFSQAVRAALEGLGATVQHGDLVVAKVDGAVAVSAPDGPDLSYLAETNLAARRADVRWVAIFPFGDAVVTGPLVQPLSPPCFHCFELRWLGISPSIALERAYFAHLRRGGFRDGAVTAAAEAARLIGLATPVLASRFVGRAANRVALTDRELAETREGPLHGHPRCGVCAPPAALKGEHASAPSRQLWLESPHVRIDLSGSADELAAEPCGLAAVVPPWPQVEGADLEVLAVSVARFAFPDPDEVDGPQENWCHGSALDPEEARFVAIVEAVERYSGLSPPKAGVWSSYANVRANAIDPRELPLFSQAQYERPGFPFAPFAPEQIVRWSWGYNLTRNRRQLIPTSAAWYGYDDSLLGESSNGVAAHSSRGRALLNGILEVVERDAFMIHWLHRLSPPQFDIEQQNDDLVCALAHRVHAAGYEVRLLDLTTDLAIPVALAVGFRTDRARPALLIGAGAALRPEAALRHALSELYAATFSTGDSWIPHRSMEPRSVRTLSDHARAYAHPDWLPRASFLWASDRRTEASRTGRDGNADALVDVIRRLASHGHDVIGVDITPSDVEHHGLFIVRAIVPGLQPLALGAGPRLGGRRLYEAPVRMGYREAPAREADLNPDPHCFP
jgi:ribosomal protein S12 methylthiotransferase accessory factor